MNTIFKYSRTKAVISFLFLITSSAKSEGLNDGNELQFKILSYNKISPILRMISDKMKNNYDSIKYWEGKVDSEVNYIYEGKNADRIFTNDTMAIGEVPKRIMNHAESSIEFSLDAKDDRLFVYRFFNKKIQYIDFDTGRDLGTKGLPGEEKAILTKEYYIKCRATQRQNGVIIKQQAIKEKLSDCTHCQNPPIFDPRESFKEGRPVWETVQIILDKLDKKGEWKIGAYDLKVEECNDKGIMKYQIIMPGKISEGDIVLSKMVFSCDKGFNITFFQVSDVNGKVFQKATWDYELKDGIYLPKETLQQNYTGEKANLSYSIKSIFKNLKLNYPIQEEIFSYKNLGLKNGDKFVDKIEGKEYTYQEGNLIPLTEPNK